MVDQTFLDFLVANARDELKPDPAKLGDVVLVRMREEDRKEFAAWPPRPIDYQMVVDRLAAHQPRVLVIADALHWPEAKPEETGPLAASLQKAAPRIVLAAEVSTSDPAAADSLKPLTERLPKLSQAQGAELLPQATSATAAPGDVLLRQGDVGLTMAKSQPLAMRLGDTIAPSLPLQTLANAGGVPFEQVRLRTGPGAGVHLGDAWFVPAQADGQWTKSTAPIASVSALDVMTPEVVDSGDAWKKTLGQGRVVVLGMDHDGGGPTNARTVASIAAEALALPRLHVLPMEQQIAAWVVAGLMGAALLRWPRHKAIVRSLLMLALALLASYLAFQSLQMWCPPAIPAALIVASGLLVRLFGHRQPNEAMPVALSSNAPPSSEIKDVTP